MGEIGVRGSSTGNVIACQRDCRRRIVTPIDTGVSNTESMDVGLAYQSQPVGPRPCHKLTPSR